ncbi:MAG: hypothetical protein WCO42_01925 [bacterium]
MTQHPFLTRLSLFAIQIVDFHHAAEHVASLAKLIHPRDSGA